MSFLEQFYPGAPATWAVLVVLVQTTVVIAVAGLLARLLARLGAAARYSVWFCALVCVALCPLMALAGRGAGLTVVSIPVSAELSALLEPETVGAGGSGAAARPAAGKAAAAPVPLPAPAAPLAAPQITPPTDATRGPAPRHDAPAARHAPVIGTAQAEDPAAGRAAAGPSSPRAAEVSGTAGAPATPRGGWQALVGAAVLAWVTGALWLCARLVHGLRWVGLLRRGAEPLDARRHAAVLARVRQRLGVRRLGTIAVSRRVPAPMTVGLWHSTVLLPERLLASLGESELEDVLVHECAHAARRDVLVGLLQRLLALVFWPHPLIHVLNRQLSRAREEVCDNYVIGSGDARRYAETLLSVAQRVPVVPQSAGIGLLTPHRKLEDRVAGLLNKGRNMLTRTHRFLAASLFAVLAATGLMLAGVRLGAATTDEPAAVPTRAADDPAGAARKSAAKQADPAEQPVEKRGKTVNGLRISLNVDPKEWITGGNVRFACTIENVADKPIRIPRWGMMDFSRVLEIRDAQGKAVYWDGGRNGTKGIGPDAFPVIAPGKSREFVVTGTLRRLPVPETGTRRQLAVPELQGGRWFWHDLSPGAYTVRAVLDTTGSEELLKRYETARNFQLWRGAAESDPVTIDVVKAPIISMQRWPGLGPQGNQRFLDFIVHADRRFRFRETHGRLPQAAIDELLNRLAKADVGEPTEDAETLTFRWSDADGRSHEKIFTSPQAPDRRRLLERIGQLAAKHAAPRGADAKGGNQPPKSAEKNGLAVSVRAAKAAFAAGEPLTFDVTLKNVSDGVFRLADPTHVTAGADPVRYATWTHTILPGPWQALGNIKFTRVPQPRTLAPGGQVTVRVEMNASYEFVWKGERQGPVALKHLPAGRYQYQPTIRFGGFRDNNPIGYWTGTITAPPAEFTIAAASDSKDAAPAPAAPKQGGKPVGGLQVSLSADKNPTALLPDGSNARAVQFTVTFTNVGEQPIKLDARDLPTDGDKLKITVAGPEGGVVIKDDRPLIRRRREPPKPADFPTLEPGGTHQVRFSSHGIGKFLQIRLTKPGTYRFQVAYHARDQQYREAFAQDYWMGSATSNEYALTVREAARADEPEPAEKNVARVDLDALADKIRPKAAEQLWRTIPWCRTAAEAEKLSQQEDRPIFVWTTSGPPFEHC